MLASLCMAFKPSGVYGHSTAYGCSCPMLGLAPPVELLRYLVAARLLFACLWLWMTCGHVCKLYNFIYYKFILSGWQSKLVCGFVIPLLFVRTASLTSGTFPWRLMFLCRFGLIPSQRTKFQNVMRKDKNTYILHGRCDNNNFVNFSHFVQELIATWSH